MLWFAFDLGTDHPSVKTESVAPSSSCADFAHLYCTEGGSYNLRPIGLANFRKALQDPISRVVIRADIPR